MSLCHHLHIYPLLLLFILHVITSSPLPLAPHRIRHPLTSTPSRPLIHKYEPQHAEQPQTSRHAAHIMQTTSNSDITIYPNYNSITGASLYYPSELNLVFDIRTPKSTSFYDLVETSWNDGTMLFLEYASSPGCPVHLYLGYPNATRQEITQDYWQLNNPWCLGQDLGYLPTADPNIVLVTFEGLGASSTYTPLGFALVNLTASSPPTVLPQFTNQNLSDWVTTFRLSGNPEPLYNTNGTVLNPSYIVPSDQQGVLSQLVNIQSYVVNVVGKTPSDPNWGILLLVRLMATGSTRFIKYDQHMNVQFDTILVPAVSVPDLTPYYFPNQGSVVGYVSADPDGHIYVLIDIMDYQRPIVANYHADKLNTANGNTKPSILFVINRDTGAIIRADWVPFNIDLPFDYSIAAGLSTQSSDGNIALILNGIRYDTNTVGTVLHFIDFDINNIAATPNVQSAVVNTYPQAIRDACHQPYQSVFATGVTHLTDGRYALSGYHGYQIIGNYATAATGFVAIFDLEQLHATNLTSKLVWNVGVYGRDNSITHMSPSPSGGLTFGMTLDSYVGNVPSNLRYFRSAVFKTKPGWQTQAQCDALSTSTWTLSCSPQSCVTWCTSMTPNPSVYALPAFTLTQSSSCAAFNQTTPSPTGRPATPTPTPTSPTTRPTTPGHTDGNDAAAGDRSGNSADSSSSSTPRSTQLGVGLGIGLGGGLCCLGLIAGICIGRRKRGYTSPRTDPQQEGGVPIEQVPHQRLEETGGGEGEAEGNAV